METMTSARAYKLSDAIMDMTNRYGEAERQHAYAFSAHLRHQMAGQTERAAAELADAERWNRAAQRRRAGIYRLTRCLRDLDR